MSGVVLMGSHCAVIADGVGTMNPIWTYEVTENGKKSLKLQKLLQKQAQPALAFLSLFDIHSTNNLVHMYQTHSAWRSHIDEQARKYAAGVLKADGYDLSSISINVKLLYENDATIL